MPFSKYTKQIASSVMHSISMLMLAIIFLFDLYFLPTVSLGAIYTIIIFYNWVFSSEKVVLFYAFISTLLVLLSFFNIDTTIDQNLIIESVISICTIWICATIIYLSKKTINIYDENKIIADLEVDERTKELNNKVQKLDYVNVELNENRRILLNIVNELSASEELIKEKQKQMQLLMENIPVPTIIFSGTSIEFVNQAYLDLFGYSLEELNSGLIRLQHLVQFLHKEEDLNINKLRSIENLNQEKFIGKRKNGSVFKAELIYKCIRFDDFDWNILMIQDITQRIKAEELKLRATKIAAKNEELQHFLHIASHDLQEPLVRINTLTHAIEDNYTTKNHENTAKLLQYLSESSTKMSRVIEDLVLYSRIGRNRDFTHVNLNYTTHKVIESINDDFPNIKYEIADLSVIIADTYEVESLLFQLLHNAAKYSSHKGKDAVVNVYTKVEADRELKIIIADNGIGINQDYYDRIFHPFQQLNNEFNKVNTSSGIGLAVATKIANLYNGEIIVDSVQGEGSTFIIKLEVEVINDSSGYIID